MATKNVINTGMPIEVANGGTGAVSATAYSVICGGTTSTDPLQSVASVGTSGQVLSSHGPAALPTFRSASSGTSILGSSYFTPLNQTYLAYAVFFTAYRYSMASITFFSTPIPRAGTFSNLYYYLYTNGSTVATTATLNVNGVNTTLVATAPAGTTGTFTDLVNSAAVNAGDLIAIEMSSSAGGNTHGGFSVLFT